MPRKSKRRKRRDKCREPEPNLTYRERSIMEEQERLRYESTCKRIGQALAGKKTPPRVAIIEKLRRMSNEFENRRND